MNPPSLARRLRCAILIAPVKRLMTFMLSTATLLALSASAMAEPAWASPAGSTLPPLPRILLNAGIHLIQAEIAADDATRARGLMFRQSLGASDGMLFVFPHRDTQCFWMRNTLVPLSIAFLSDDGVVVNIADMAPETETAHCSAQPVRYALEMNQGWFAERGLGINAIIEGLQNQLQ